ncbi:RNA recognition motif domain-containing protein [Kaarinaea lacus]
MKKLFVGNLDASIREDDLKALFAEFGTVRSFSLATDIFSGKCKGFGFIEMEGHEARAAIDGLDGKDYRGRPMKVKFESPRHGGHRR